MKSPSELRTWIRVHGLGLGLPATWLDALPTIEMLPGDNLYDAAWGYGKDAFLVWKQQEMLVRLGRLDEINRALVAEALEDAALADGPKWIKSAVEKMMFILSWPRWTYSLRVDLQIALESLEECLEGCPSAELFLTLDRRWQKVRYKLLALDEDLDLPKACPWATLAALEAAVKARLQEGREGSP